jgi:hypothetical protein
MAELRRPDPAARGGVGVASAGSRPGVDEGNWYNPDTTESLGPNLDHAPPIGPHYDYKYRGMPGKGWRVYEDGRIVPKP